MLAGTAVKAGSRTYMQFSLSDRYCDDLMVSVQRDGRLMRIALPNDPQARQALVNAVMGRSGDHASPEVFRFREGRFTFEELAADPAFDALEARIAQRLKDARDAEYRKQVADEAHQRKMHPPAPPIPPPPPTTPPPPMTEEDWAAFWAEQPPLKRVQLDRVNADTVWVKISGRVMLNGGCGSGMPLFGIEMLTDTGWAERIPFDLTQMDCGMPWADWEDHVVMLPPLRWWIGAHQPEGMKEMRPGSYRIVLMGGNMQAMRTAPLEVR